MFAMGGSGSIVVGSYVVGDGVGSSVLHGHSKGIPLIDFPPSQPPLLLPQEDFGGDPQILNNLIPSISSLFAAE